MRSFAGSLFFVCVLLLNGCATTRAIPNSRLGLLDRFKRLEEVTGVPQADHKTVTRVRGLASGWRWPLQRVEVTSPFGRRGEEFHEGVDLRAPKGTPVYSANSGIVLYAGNKIIGYGKMIVIKHESGLATVYGHNSKIYVKRGERVKQGQKIASSGKTGRATGAHLHFEVRDGSVALDPMTVLPSRMLVRSSAP